MKSDGEIMEILAAYDLTGSLRATAELTGCSHHTVAKHVAARDAGRPIGEPAARGRVTDTFLPKIEEWIEGSKGRIRADKAHEKLLALGYTGSERSTRRAIAQVKAAWRLGHTRVHRPWITEPGMWLQYDFGDGPRIGGVKTILFVAWLAFSRFRIVIPLHDRTAPSVFAALDRCFRILGGAPTYVLTDNEKTVTTGPYRRGPGPEPADPGLRPALRYHRADLPAGGPCHQGWGRSVRETRQGRHRAQGHEPVAPSTAPSPNSRRPARRSWTRSMTVSTAMTRRKPAAMLAEEAPRLHRIPDTAHTVAFGLARTVPGEHPDGHLRNGQYSVPAHLLGPGCSCAPTDRTRRAGHHRPRRMPAARSRSPATPGTARQPRHQR